MLNSPAKSTANNTAFHTKEMCNVIIFIVSWLIIHTKNRDTLIEQSLTLIQQSGKADIL